MNATEWEPIIRETLDVIIIYSYIVIFYIIMKLVHTFVSSYTDIKVAKITGKEKEEDKKEPLIKKILSKLKRKDEIYGLEKSKVQ